MVLEFYLSFDWNYLPDLDRPGAGMIEMYWISDYANEQEVFFIGGFANFGIVNIISIDYAIDYCVYTYALSKLFNCISNHALSYSEQNMFERFDGKVINQICFRMLLHEMHSHYPE
eukprot:70838_1